MLASETMQKSLFTEVKPIIFSCPNGIFHISCESCGEARDCLRALRARVSAGLKHRVEVKVRPWV